MMRKITVVAIVAASAIAGATAAWAVLSGTITGTVLNTGVATGTGTQPCQSTSINWTLADPAWDPAEEKFLIPSVTYNGFDLSCVSASADLNYAIVRITSGNTIQSGAVTPSSASGSITITNGLDASIVDDINIQYLVVG